ncbi:uncharacterized protein BX664DRAFT_264605, partial [Halteromyces radiatus]|uniref:uncharacterized protein n=1 Tax=Halteromyces radiatus TaxID=101107 RepID=UPI0022209EA0
MKNECNLSFKKVQLHSVVRNSDDNIDKRYDWIIKWTRTDMDFLGNCIFIDESGFHINMRRGLAW